MHIKKPLMISLMALSFLIIVSSFFGVFMCQSCFSSEKEVAKVIDLIAKSNYSSAITILKSLATKSQDPYTKTQNQYFTATCYRKQNDWAKAISFYQLVAKEKSSKFADISLFRIAKHHQEIKDYKSAIKEYSEILADHPNSICAIESLYQLAECYYSLKQYDNAIENYKKFAEKYPGTTRSRLAEYRVGYVYQESQRFPEAYTQYQKVIQKYTETYAARTALDRIKLLKASSSINISREDNLYMGMVLFYAKQYKGSREYFAKAINGTDELSAKASYFVAQSYQKECSYAAAQNEYESIIKLYPKTQYEINSQYNIGQCVWYLGKTGEAISLLSKFASKYPENEFADDARYQIAKSYLDARQYDKSLDAYNELVEKHPKGDSRDKALWDMGWCYMKLKKKDKSASVFQKLISEYPDSKLAGSARFWTGMSYEDDGKIEEAVNAYKSAMEYRDWYYSDRAKKRIESLVKKGKIDKEQIPLQYKKAEYDEFLPILSNVRKYTPFWVQVSLSFGVFDDAIDVYNAANEAGVALESAYYNLSVCYKMMGDYRRSWAYAWQLTQLPDVKGKKGELPRQIYSKLYPTIYNDFVFKYAKSNKVDPYLVFAVIREESRFDSNAISSSNANGLMQIMPDTGKECANQVDHKDFKVENLFEPEVNIKLGAWYLSGLINNFNKRAKDCLSAKPELDYNDIATVLALGGYNGGPTRVKNWMGEYGINDIDEFVESIPMQEPRNYIKKVMDSYETYKALYGG